MLPALAIQARLEVHRAALQYREAVAQPVVPTVFGGPDAERGRPDAYSKDAQPFRWACPVSVDSFSFEFFNS